MIDIKCKKENLIKFKNETTDCSTINIYTNLIKKLNKNNQQNDLLSKLTNLIDRKEFDNVNKTEIENYKIDDLNLDYQNNQKDNKDLNIDNKNDDLEKENIKSNESIDFQNKTIDILSNKKSINESDNINSVSSQQNNQDTKLKDRSSPNSSNNQQPTTSQQANQQTNQQKSQQSIIHHQTHSNESHNVHFSTNKNEKQSTISIGHFSIYLDRLDYEYRPADTLTGKLHLLLESGHLNLRCVVVYLKGISSVKFTEREYQSTSQSERHFEDVEYWSDHFLLEMKCRPRLSNNVKFLEPGEYHLPFKFTFPSSGLPSSFESAFGYIRYWIYAEIRSKDKNRDSKDNHHEEDSNIATTELPVEVYSACPVPIEELRRPINAEQLKIMECCTCLCIFRNPDFIQVRANLMHQGQRKGSSIQVNLFIVNRSNKQIIPYVILKSRSEFRAVNKTKVNEIEIIGCPGNSVKSGETIMQSILIPLSYELPIIYDSPNIIITYRVKIAIEIPNSFDINFHLPIILTNEKFPIRPISSNS